MSAEVSLSLLDHRTAFRVALERRFCAEAGFEVRGSFSNAEDAMAGAPETSADVLICAYALGAEQMDGVTMLRALRSSRPQQAVIVLAPSAGPGLVRMAMSAGANGVVSEYSSWQQMVAAARSAAAGGAPVIARASAAWLQPRTFHDPLQVLEHPLLTGQELEVLRCSLAGLPVSAIARKQCRSEHTVSTQKRSAFGKLGVRTDAQLSKLMRGR